MRLGLCGACFLVLLAAILPGVSSAQTLPDSAQMPEVELIGFRNKTLDGLKTVQTDSLQLALNKTYSLSELLSRSSSVFIKNYGPGALALPSFRGTTAGHTKLYWNGLPLTSPMLGVADLNLVPVFAIDAVELQYGNAGLQQGSGGFGGNISLNTSSLQRNILQAELMQNMGSFGLNQTQFKAIYGRRIVASTRIFQQKADNNFPFIHTAKLDSPIVRQQNASYNQYGFVQTIDGELKDKLWFSAAVWHQRAEKELPPLMTTANNEETQEDEATRATFQLKKYRRNVNYYVDAGYSRERLNYDNVIADIHSRSIFQRAYIYPHLRLMKLKNIQLDAGLQAILDEATSPKYSRKNQQRIGLPVTLQSAYKSRLQLSLILRPETVNFTHNTFSFSANGNYELLKNGKLNIYANAGKNYNNPTLNDLYWYPGGNPDLLPENALSGEFGLKNAIASRSKRTHWNTSVSFFSTTVDHYIQWQQGSQGFWSPQNLKKVWSRGAEISSKLVYKVSKNTVSLSGNYSYVKSTSQRALNAQDNTVGKQLIYVPHHTAQTSAVFMRGKSIFSAQYIYTHFRYTPTSFLPAYGLLNLQAETGFQLKKTELRASVKCNNLLNKSYQAIEWRPMPGRWFEAGLAIKFSQSL